MRSFHSIIISCSILLAGFSSCAQNAKSNYKIAHKFSVEGDAGWDYVAIDEASARLFISHGNITQVIDATTGKLLNTIPDTKGVHGIALDADENKAFISNGKDTSVTIVNLTTLRFIARVKVSGMNPDAILYDNFSHRVFVYNGRTSNATVIDAKTNEVIASIPLEGKPEYSVSDGNGKVYVNIEDKSLMVVIDATTLKVINSWSIAPGSEPSGLAIDNLNHRLFAVCDNKMMVVMNAVNGSVLTTLPIGEHVDGCAFDPELKRAYSSNGDGTITVVQEENPNKFLVLENITTQKGARTICVDTKTHHLYLPTATYGEKPAATADNTHPRAGVIAGSFVILDVSLVK
jgi:YVTN family beta-propeller protein